MDTSPAHLLLADDDNDDCVLFKDALEELGLPTSLTTIHDGEQLIQRLRKTAELPDILFLDLNIPRKNGLECLIEIKLDPKLKKLPVIIYSTSFDPDVINLLYKNGAQYYIRKPSNFSTLKRVIGHALTLMLNTIIPQSDKENFVIHP